MPVAQWVTRVLTSNPPGAPPDADLRDRRTGAHQRQNELLEQAAEHEVIARGALITEDLAVAAANLAAPTEAAHRYLMAASIAEFAAGEALGEPIQASQISRSPERTFAPQQLIAIAAFRTQR
ncbi:MAG TPA: hypothetical protein VL068_05430 [Microthrixaceae bacterium]|nr:hypothetical protein [Microthrixaceae bacterium]